MKKRIKWLLISILMMFFSTKIEALSVSKTNITLEPSKSENIELYANTEDKITSLDFTLIFSTYDIPAEFIVNNKYTDKPNKIKHHIEFKEEVTGKILLGTIKVSTIDNPKEISGIISIHTVSAKTNNDETVNLKNQTINVKINKVAETKVEEPSKKETEKITKETLLDKIESSITNIELKENIYEYNITINNEIEELDLKPIVKDKNTKIDITTQKIKELNDNKIIITLTNNDIKEIYTINVSVKNKFNSHKVEIDKEEFKEDKTYKNKWFIIITVLGIAFVGSILVTKK